MCAKKNISVTDTPVFATSQARWAAQSSVPVNKPSQFDIGQRRCPRAAQAWRIPSKIILHGKLAQRQFQFLSRLYSEFNGAAVAMQARRRQGWHGAPGGEPEFSELLFFNHLLGVVMNALIAAAKEFGRDEEGITAIEYGLIAALMAAAIATAIAPVSAGLLARFSAIAATLTP
jgi:pilus assembly protein Flp/PilA